MEARAIKRIQSLNDYFIDLDARPENDVCFYRINGYSGEIHEFIKRYYDAARRTGVIIEGRLPNPDEKQLSYYTEIMGTDFQLSVGFISSGLKKWLPRTNDCQRQNLSMSLYDSLDAIRRAGKTENMLKNAYIKFMCWLYYKFERIVNQLGANHVPKILYEGEISYYELMLISALSNAGCDVILLQYRGDAAYLKEDPDSSLSYGFSMYGLQAFPQDFSLRKIREEIQNKINNERLYGIKPAIMNCTNAWITGRGFDDFRESVTRRGSDPGLYYNCYYRINGAEDKLTYANELYQFQSELKNSKRKVVIVNEEIAKPSTEEIAQIRRGHYDRLDQMILDLSANIRYTANIELQRIMNKAFVDVMLMEAEAGGDNLNRLTGKAVYLLCWLKRYENLLFGDWKAPDISCFIYMGGCRNESEALFIRFLARLPADVLILCPNLNTKCCLTDNLLYELNYEDSLVMDQYPEDNSQVRIGTAAYHAERELDSLLYQDSGMYRNQQYARAAAISLQTMYEEIRILWDQELKYRPSFSTFDGVVHMPVIFAKVSGVKDRAVAAYWSSIGELITEDTIFIRQAPYIQHGAANSMRAFAPEFYKNGKILRSRIKNHPNYQYYFLREDKQEFILDKLELMIEQRPIKGMFENGTEYAVIAAVLDLPQDIVRLIQKFDFTKKNPKLIYVNTTEMMISLEDSILTAFLNLIGFDILFFVPTGYQNVERYFNKNIMEEHQIGEYVYDLQVPDRSSLLSNHTRPRWRDKIFKRGN